MIFHRIDQSLQSINTKNRTLAHTMQNYSKLLLTLVYLIALIQFLPSASFADELPTGWNHQDIGSPSLSGDASYESGEFTIDGAGADIWGNSDQFHFIYQDITGNISIVSKVESIENTNTWAKAGVMIRETTAANSRNAMILVSAGSGLSFQRRTSAGGSTSYQTASGSAPHWIKLEKMGDSIKAYESSNGSSWTQVGSSVTMTLSGTFKVGLAVTSHDASQLNTSVFSNVLINRAPVVDAGQDDSIDITGTLTLDGTFSDDGLPESAEITWSKTSGPGTAAFGDVGSLGSTATFSAGGTYIIRLTVNDGDITSYDEISVNVFSSTTLTSASAGNEEVSLEWNSSGGTGYKVKYGTSSGTYTNTVDVGDVTSYVVTGLTNDTTYYFVVVAYSGEVESNNSNELSSTPSSGELPAGWSHQDIGSPSLSGDAVYYGSEFTLEGAGTDIVGTADQFHYAYQFFQGNASIIAKVESMENTNAWAKVGVMIRETTTAGSKNAATLVTISNGIRFQTRTSTDGSTAGSGSGGSAPYWVKLERIGDTFKSYKSSDGSSWSQVGSNATISMSGTITVGLAVTSHNTSELNTSVFSNVSINRAPIVDAGQDDTIDITGTLTLNGTFNDDGLTESAEITWSKTSGPGMATFADANLLNTTAVFSMDGTYVLRLTIDDGDFSVYDEVVITVEVDDGTYVSGVVSVDTTWEMEGSPYIIVGDVTIANNASLTIDAGVEVRFDGNYKIESIGILKADGVLGNEIVITSNQASPAVGDWNTIEIKNDKSYLNYAHIEYADKGVSVPSSIIGGKNPYIQNSTLTNNNLGIYFEPGTATNIIGNTITLNGTGIYAVCNVYSGCSPKINENSIFDNSEYNIYTDSWGTNASATTIDATYNWWGTTNSSAIAASIWDKADVGTLPEVDFTPYLQVDPDEGVHITNNSVSSNFINLTTTSTVNINYTIDQDADITIEIYDNETSTLVRTLVNGTLRLEGAHAETWDLKNGSAQALPAGVYVYRITAETSGGSVDFYGPDGVPDNDPVISNASITPSSTFNPSKGERLKIDFDLDEPAYVSIGFEGDEFISDAVLNTGSNTLFWGGWGDNGLWEYAYGNTINIDAAARRMPDTAIILDSGLTLDISAAKADPYVIRPLYNDMTTIYYTITEAADVTVSVLTPNGLTELDVLEDDVSKGSGSYELTWDGRDSAGAVIVTEGDYRIRIKAEDAYGNVATRDTNIRVLY